MEKVMTPGARTMNYEKEVIQWIKCSWIGTPEIWFLALVCLLTVQFHVSTVTFMNFGFFL